MTIHLRHSSSPLPKTHNHEHHNNHDDNASWRRFIIVLLAISMMLIFFANQFQDVSVAKDIEDENNKLKFETITTTTGSTIGGGSVDTNTAKDVVDDSRTNTKANTVTAPATKDGDTCTLDCTDLKHKRIDQFTGDLSNRQTMLELASRARHEMEESIRKHYGQYFEDIFAHGFQPISEISTKRLQRKLQIKALKVQIQFAKEEQTCRQDCQLLINPNPSPIFQSHHSYYERYVWATGGHSAAAGHGNLFNESYTAILEQDLQPLFAAIGMEMEGRNFAMGGTRSGLEIAMCFEQVFGSDVDFFSWDYGMTDGRKDSLLFHYGYRGVLSPNRPGMLGVWTNGWKGRGERLKDLEQIGLATFYRPAKEIDAMNAAFPDSGDITEAQLQELPDYVRNFKCQGQIEKGDPHCGDDKYSKGICDNRASKVSWHPGAKQHGVDGHMLAMFLSENLIKALKGLVEHANQDAESLLGELMEEEDKLLEQILQTKLDDYNAWKIYDPGNSAVLDSDIDLELLYKGKSICHTARTPAITRYLGYLTNTDKVGGVAPYESEQYDTGIEKKIADSEGANGEMRLVWEFNAKDRQKCEVPLRPDYKDFFYSHHKDGLVKLTFPNEKEKAAYKYKQSEMKGVVILVLNECDWGKCHEGDLKLDDIDKGDVKIKINGVDVTKVVNIGSGCLILKHKDGVQFEPSRNDDYEIAVQVMVPNSYLRISSIIIY